MARRRGGTFNVTVNINPKEGTPDPSLPTGITDRPFQQRDLALGGQRILSFEIPQTGATAPRRYILVLRTEEPAFETRSGAIPFAGIQAIGGSGAYGFELQVADEFLGAATEKEEGGRHTPFFNK